MNDNIDQQVKFKSTSQEVYDHLAEKDPNSLYFAEDSQKLYKGDTQFSNGLIDESNFIPIYELSEDEYWDKYNSGQLDLAGYKYEGMCVSYNELDENILWDTFGGMIDTGDKYYVASYAEVVGGVLTEISKDLQSIKSFNLNEMVPQKDNEHPLSFLRYCYQYNDLIGYDDDGYLYINVTNCRSVATWEGQYSAGVLAINTKDIDNSGSWNIITDFDPRTEAIAFHPINFQKYLHCDDMYPNWAPLMYQDPMLKSKNGGVFGFSYGSPKPEDSSIHKQSNYHFPESGWGSVHYFKSGVCGPLGGNSLPDIDGGCRCFTTNPDNDNNLYYINASYDGSRNRLSVGVWGEDNSSKIYYVDSDDSMTSFTSTCAANASFIRCKNNKVFMFIGNTNPVCAVLDLKSEEYSNIHKFTDFTFDAKREEQVISNILETDTSICFTVFNGQTCQYVCWNFVEDKIYSRASTVYLNGSSPDYWYLCNILRLGNDNTLISSCIDLYNQELNIVTLSCENLQPVRRYVVSNVSQDCGGLRGQPIYETSDNHMIVFAYMFDSATAKAISIDSNGNSTLLAGGEYAPASDGSGTTDILISTSEPGLFLGFDIGRSGNCEPRYMIDVNRNRFWRSPSCIGLHNSQPNAVIIDNNTVINMSYTRKNDIVINDPTFLIDAGRAVHSYIQSSSIKILSSGDITQ